MRTLPREPWRGGQICGWNIGSGLPGSRFCGEFKIAGSYLCPVHDAELREENDGRVPKFARGNALGLAEYRRAVQPYLFRLSWEPLKGEEPKLATEKEVEAWLAS